MTVDDASRSRITVTHLDEFLRKPPSGFSVDRSGSEYCVHTDPDKNLVLIDDFQSCRGKVLFHKSMRRKVKMRNLREYSRVRKSLLSKRIYLLMSACERNSSHSKDLTVLKHFVVSIDGKDPFIQWQMERGLDWTIASVAGESFTVHVDLTEVLENWAEKNYPVTTENRLTGVRPVWRDTSFTLKYCSDAMFDFPHWLGFSRRTFKKQSNGQEEKIPDAVMDSSVRIYQNSDLRPGLDQTSEGLLWYLKLDVSSRPPKSWQ